MYSFLAALASWLRVHQLGVSRVLLLFNFAPDLLVSQMLAQKEGLLVGEELIRRTTLFALLLKSLWLKAAIFVIRLSVFLHTLLLKPALPVHLPVVHPLHVL